MYTIKYISDSEVTAELDSKLRALLHTCFTDKESAMFETQRYFKEMPAHRWLVYTERGDLVGHAAVHDKVVKTKTDTLKIGGVADVCVHPEYRRKGIVKQILNKIFYFLKERGIQLSILFGEQEHYASSGYMLVSNFFTRTDSKEWKKSKDAFVKELEPHAWPKEYVYLEGLIF